MKIAVIGIGVMGSAIAGRLCDSACEVFLFDTDPAKGEALVERGAVFCKSASHAAEHADYVIVSLNTAQIVEAVVFGPGGIAEAGSDDKLLIDMSSIDAGMTAELARRLFAQTGMGWVDAPLSGGAPAAQTGTLTLMVGGKDADVEGANAVLELLSTNRTHFGPPGAGQTVKSINQIFCATHFIAVAEAVRFAEDHDVDASLIPAALAGGRADSSIMQEFMAKMARRDFSPTGRIDNMLKDLKTVESASVTPLPITQLITQLHRQLVDAGLGAADSAEYIKMFDLPRS